MKQLDTKELKVLDSTDHTLKDKHTNATLMINYL